jgi:hypothetical protein
MIIFTKYDYLTLINAKRYQVIPKNASYDINI